MSFKITFMPSGASGRARGGDSVLKAAKRMGVKVSSVCGGLGLCGTCRVRLEKGQLSPATAEERVHLDEDELASGLRLACQARIEGDSEVTVVVAADEYAEVSGKPVGAVGLDVDPAVRSFFVELDPPTLDDPEADAERLVSGLAREYGLAGAVLSREALAGLPGALRDGSYAVSAAVRKGEVLRVRPGRAGGAFGVAFDVGTTTVAGYLCDLQSGKVLSSGAMTNPQAAYGEDVMSRISSAAGPGGGAGKMRAGLTDGMNAMLERLVGRAGEGAGITGPRDISEAVVVGNTAMHHLLFGLPVENLGVSPFTPALARGLEVKAADAGIAIDPEGYVLSLPIIGGFVGADCTAAILAAGPFEPGEAALLVDVGTNGEIVLFAGGRLLAASCATGPALEGAQIKNGMRAAPGAIDRVVIDPDTLEPSYTVVGRPGWSRHAGPTGAKGICGSGVVDAVAQMYAAGVIGADGSFSKGLSHERVRRGGQGGARYVIARAEETGTGFELAVSQADVRAVQLAKAALFAGAAILMAEAGVRELDRVLLAGSFGSRIDARSALAIGMLPGVPLERAGQAGNAAGEGAVAALMSVAKRRQAKALASSVRYVELSAHPGFQDAFLAAIPLP